MRMRPNGMKILYYLKLAGQVSKLGPYITIPGNIDPSKFEFHTYRNMQDQECIYYGGVMKQGDKYLNHGVGLVIREDGLMVEGNFTNGQIEGDNRVVYPNGDYYQGQYEDHFRHGQGIYHYQDGRTLQGRWKCGKKDGIIKTTYPNGAVKYQQWDHGTLLKSSSNKSAFCLTT